MSCSRAPVTPAAPAVPPPAGAPDPAPPKSPKPQLPHDATADDLGKGFDVQPRCAPEFCDGAPWVSLEFRNSQSNTLVLETPYPPEKSRTWATADVTGTWEDDSGFGLGGSVSLCQATDGGACWAGTPMLVAGGASESFEIRAETAQEMGLVLNIEIPWLQSATLSALDAQEVRRGWQIKARPSGPRHGACVPMECTMTAVAVQAQRDEALPPAPSDINPDRHLQVYDDGTCWVVWRRKGCRGTGRNKRCVSVPKPEQVRCP